MAWLSDFEAERTRITQALFWDIPHLLEEALEAD
jgi:hypothetical protein